MPARALTVVATDVAPVGGMERVAYEIARRLGDRGWDLTVIARTCALAGGDANVRWVRLRGPARPESVAFPLAYLQATWAVRRHARGLVQVNNALVATPVDVVVVNFCEAAYRSHVGITRSRRANLAYRLNSAIVSRINLVAERWSYHPRRARLLACVSRGVDRDVLEFHPPTAGHTVVIPNGVDRAAFAPDEAVRAAARGELGIGDDEPVALFVGGDWHRKGLAHAIGAVARAPGWRLVVVGDGDQEHFGALAAGQGAADRVHFTGHTPEPQRWFRAADALTFPSSYEAFSLVTLEAAAAGLVLIAPRINGTEELIADGENGWLTPADADAIAARLNALSADRDLLARLRDGARRTSERYDWERIVDAYEALYAELT